MVRYTMKRYFSEGRFQAGELPSSGWAIVPDVEVSFDRKSGQYRPEGRQKGRQT
jgi:hypothetical protein